MAEVFDGISLEELEGNESPIIEKTDIKETIIKKPATKAEKDEVEIDTTGNVDLDELAKLETIDTIQEDNEEGDDNEDESGNKTSQTPAKKTTKASPSSGDTFTSLASALVEAGVFSSLAEEDIKEIVDVKSLMDAVRKQVSSNEFAGLNENQKQYLEALKTGIPQPEFATRKYNAEQYKNITDDQISAAPALAKELIKRSFIIKGFTDDQADKYASLALKSDTAIDEATEARDSLITYEEDQIKKEIETKKAERIVKDKEVVDKISALKSKVTETSEIIPGIKVNSTTKDKIFESMTTPVKMNGEDPLNSVMLKYKEDAEYKLKLHTLDVITKGFTDFSKFKTTTKSNAVLELEETLRTQGTTRTGSPGTLGKTTMDIGESLKSLNFNRKQ